jgi:hypothetical protein
MTDKALGLTEMRAMLAKVRYKPGWSFYLKEVTPESYYFDGCASVTVFCDVPDTYHPEFTVQISASYPVPYYLPDEEAFLHWLRGYVINAVEQHESDEWFRYEGVLVNDPHAVKPENRKLLSELL